MKIKLALSLLILLLVSPPVSGTYAVPPLAPLVARPGEKFVRTELYFGLTKPDKSTLTDVEWSLFVDEVITPRFPDGFTIVDGRGQWRNREGVISKEYSKVFIVVYSRKERGPVGKKIDEIRDEYKKRFDQESVLRVDMTKSVVVSF
ncbi:MAG TPA: DUF3574 domain-containing protein [Pyrinomonadaceae bacterium]